MCLTVGESENSQQVIYEQLKFIKAQEDDQVPSSNIKIRCGCLRLVSWKYMHRCLYCSVFFCKECAEEHFGKTVAQYKTENTINT